jgi:hypothetical protein
VLATETRMRARYADVRQVVLARLDALEKLLSDPAYWWNHAAGYAETRDLFAQFAMSLRANFGAQARAWQLIDADDHREARCTAITGALAAYRQDRDAWERVLRA